MFLRKPLAAIEPEGFANPSLGDFDLSASIPKLQLDLPITTVTPA